MELRRVPVESLDLTLGRLRLLPEVAVRKMAESLHQRGQLTPLVAAEREDGLVLIDGFVRRMAAVRLGLEELLVEVVELGDVEMKAQVYLRNRDRGLMLLEECRLVHELNRNDGLNQVEIAALLERHKSWVCRRLGLFRALSPNLRSDGELQGLGSGSIRRLALLPHRNQEELLAVVQRERLSSSEALLLVKLWSKADTPIARRYLLEQPREALRVAREKANRSGLDPRLGTAGQYVLDGLVALEQIGLRLVQRFRRGVEPLSGDGRAVMAAALDRSESACRDAIARIGEWSQRAQEPS
jgi:ParB-like chromosome segregation protein Spo0J